MSQLDHGSNMTDAVVSILGLMFIGVFGWTVQLGNRVSVIETQHADLKELIEREFKGLDKRLDRIERSLNGNLVRD